MCAVLNTSPKTYDSANIKMQVFLHNYFSENLHFYIDIITNLLKRNFNTDSPNKVWDTDVIYLIFKGSRAYIYLQLQTYMTDMQLHIKYQNIMILSQLQIY